MIKKCIIFSEGLLGSVRFYRKVVKEQILEEKDIFKMRPVAISFFVIAEKGDWMDAKFEKKMLHNWFIVGFWKWDPS